MPTPFPNIHQEMGKSRPTTPESPMTNSFHDANSTIDDLTRALANFSRVPSPEPPTLLACCCGKEDCENARAWLELKTRLESRLILSAEVGQALLQRHEAYVRRHEGHERQLPAEAEGSHEDGEPLPDPSALQITELVKERARLEKRLNQALVNNEVTEVSTKTILHELQEARATISRLTVHHARSVGWETRLSTAIREKDDMQQERDGESNRAKLAESRFAAMKDKAAKLQSEVRRLQDIIEERRVHRLKSSQHILQDARLRLEALHSPQLGQTAMIEHTELTNVLESLVNDNETLKRDNAELQTMLTESREEIHALQEEVEEHRAKPPSRTGARTPQLRHHIYTGSVPGSLGKDYSLQYLNPRSASLDRKYRRPFEPLTPETSRRPLSPADSLTPSEPRPTSLSQPQPRYASSHVSIEIEESPVDRDDDPYSPEKLKTHKTLLLLTRSRAVQTDTWPAMLSPSPLPSYISSSPHDPRSESSSFSDTLNSHLSALLDRFSGLLNRMSQADALTLTNRLKRQHLKGADMEHLSRSTVNSILSESTNLRSQFRFLLEDDSVVTPCTRKDFRVLFKLFKDVFAEMGELRVVLNDVILDPSCASRVSKLALNPSKVEEDKKEKERETAGGAATGGWMAPISKLFLPTGRSENSAERPGLTRSISGRGSKRPPRVIPKLGPALSASTTTVNVEFSGAAVGRSTTSTVTSPAKRGGGEASRPSGPPHSMSAVMDIFAGAPQSTTPDRSDPWVVIPKGPRRMQSFMQPNSTGEFNPSTIRRSTNRSNSHAISRDVDAVIDVERPIQDDEEPDYLAPLLQRTLRHRGLSDSSIHSTFASQAEEPRIPLSTTNDASAWPDRQSVFQTLSRTVQSLRNTAPGNGLARVVEPPVAIVPHQRLQPAEPTRVSNPGLRNLLPNLSSWAAAGNILEPTPESFLAGSVRDESFMPPRTRRPGESHGQEFF